MEQSMKGTLKVTRDRAKDDMCTPTATFMRGTDLGIRNMEVLKKCIAMAICMMACFKMALKREKESLLGKVERHMRGTGSKAKCKEKDLTHFQMDGFTKEVIGKISGKEVEL
jgi:hypothetical protein